MESGVADAAAATDVARADAAMTIGVDAAMSGSADAARTDVADARGAAVVDAPVVTPPPPDANPPAAPVHEPVFVRNMRTGETGWHASPAVADLDHDGKMEIVAAQYSTLVFDRAGKLLAKGTATSGRTFAPHVVADLDGDGVTEIVVGGRNGTVAAYEWRDGRLAVKSGWPASTDSGGQSPDARGMAAADLDGDGTIEVVVTTTNTSETGAQVFVFTSSGRVFAPRGRTGAWPRYNTTSDAEFNGAGNVGYGCYGENVGIGNIDDDPELEIIVTFDNHQINAFELDGTSVLASSHYTNRLEEFLGNRLGWGQFKRWADPKVEDDHLHLHVGPWPNVDWTMWLQFTASPPNVVDLDGDGKNEVVAVPNTELGHPYETQSHAFLVLEGSHGDGSRSARRKAGFETLPMTAKPPVRPAGDAFPPDGIPAPTTVSIVGDARPEIVAPGNDGAIHAIRPDGTRLWRHDYAGGHPRTFSSEVVVADLNRDGQPELVFGTYSLEADAGRLVVLAGTGELLHDVELRDQGTSENGIGVSAAPTIADLDGDGELEILVQTYDHGIDVFTVPGSGTASVPWPTARGNLLRNGMGPSTAP